jgi:hypothetical protein
MGRLLRTCSTLLLALAVFGVPPAAQAAELRVAADLEGQPIAVDAIPDFYCTDRDFPLIHCYKTARRLDAAVQQQSAPSGLATAATDYVVIYSGQTYSGSYMYVSQNYDVLALVGWNDRIRSYRGVNSGQGIFWTDWYRTGIGIPFCCNTWVAALASDVDRAFSSVYRS